MSVHVARPVPVVTAEVPLLAGDVMREVRTPAVNPPQNASATRDGSPEGPAVVNALATRRLSAGAVVAEQIGIDLNAIGLAEARKIMSVEHKVLGFRPPHGSLAAEAQAAAAKHPEVKGVPPPDPEKLREAAKVDAERILAERIKGENNGDTGAAKSAVAPGTGAEPVVDLSKITEDEARKLMSHEHRALGFRPPPGSLAAEAQAAAAKHSEGKPRRNSNETARKPRQYSTGANGKARRGSSENRGKARQNSVGNGNGEGKPRARSARRGSNEHAKPRRGSGERANLSGGARRTSVAASANKDDLLREAALRDAERIKATRGVNGIEASERAHVELKDLEADVQKSESITLPGPAQSNVDHDAKEGVSRSEAAAERDTATGMEGQDVNVNNLKEESAGKDDVNMEGLNPFVEKQAGITETEVAPGELEHEEPAVTPAMSRADTTDSVQIIGDVLA